MPHAIYGAGACDAPVPALQTTAALASHAKDITTILQQLNSTKNKKTAINRLTLIAEELAIRRARAAVKPAAG